MSSFDLHEGENDFVKSLPSEHYQGQAYVHWSMGIESGKQGWLTPILYYQFRDILAHTMFRFGLCCPIYCCMPDRIDMLWIGILDGSDQRHAASYFRTLMNPLLDHFGAQFEKQPYSHVLPQEQRERNAFEGLVEGLARQPELAGLVNTDWYREYSYTCCLVPGYPQLKLWDDDFWDFFWKAHTYLRQHGLMQLRDSD